MARDTVFAARIKQECIDAIGKVVDESSASAIEFKDINGSESMLVTTQAGTDYLVTINVERA